VFVLVVVLVLDDSRRTGRGRVGIVEMRTYFDHEKLDVYQLELRFITWVTALLVDIKQ
jgi:hypothetical protein